MQIKGADNLKCHVLGHAEALKIIESMKDEIERRKKSAVVAIVDTHGELIALLRIGDPPLSCTRIASNKAYTAARERQSSGAVGREVRQSLSGYSIDLYFADDRYIGWGGGIPLWREGRVLAAVGVSGLEEAGDVEIAEIGAKRFSPGLEA
jgi:glc operon protein GlcG